MSNESPLTRRGLFMKLGILFNGMAATILAVPIVRFLVSSITLGRANAYTAWVPLGRRHFHDANRAHQSGPLTGSTLAMAGFRYVCQFVSRLKNLSRPARNATRPYVRRSANQV